MTRDRIETGHSEANAGVVVRGANVSMTIFGLTAIILRHIRIVIAPALVLILIAAIVVLVGKPEYIAQSTFITQAPVATRVSGIAAQFGLTLGPNPSGETLQFYAKLIKSEDLLKSVARTEFRFASAPESADTLQGKIADLFNVDGTTPAERDRAAVDLLRRELVSVAADIESGMVSVVVKSPWPDLAERINNRLLELVNEFNLVRRQSQAASERRFIEERLRHAVADLRNGEQEHQNFLERNRTFQTSPQLAFEEARLRRQVELKQQVYNTLAQNYEQARIEEVRNTPVITIVSRPNGTARRVDSPIIILVGALLLGLGLGVSTVFGMEFLSWKRDQRPDEYAEIRRLGRDSIRLLLLRRRDEQVHR